MGIYFPISWASSLQKVELNYTHPMQKFGNAGMMEYWNDGMRKFWNNGILEYWNNRERKKKGDRRQNTEHRRQEKELPAVGGQRSFTRNIGMVEEWNDDEKPKKADADSHR